MAATLEVLFSPAEFAALNQRDLSGTTCVVVDVLRATSSMIAALAAGAEAIIPVEEIADAMAWRRKQPQVLLAGEREGVRIPGRLAGGVDFDFANSPREFTPEKVHGQTLVMTTTNGTRALRACAGARQVLVGSFLNLAATARWIERSRPAELLVVCGGTHEEAALEDALAAGGLCALIWPCFAAGPLADSAVMARRLWSCAGGDVLPLIREARNARRLLADPQLRDDVAFCVQQDRFDIVAAMDESGRVRVLAGAAA